ncbi:MAG: NADH-quinone oxidoreductase subunit F [Chloroflexi bacterium]|nr:NADH-quinone oxidoreductase subunit F [Chloroflexota bacterium]
MADFAALREQAEAEYQRWLSPGRPRIVVNLATCSLTAGAAAVVEAIRQELAAQQIDAEVQTVGCDGPCFMEPWVDIQQPGGPRIRYARLDPTTARSLVRDVIKGGELRKDLAVAVVGERPHQGLPTLASLPFFAVQHRLLMRRYANVDPENIDHYVATGGYAAFVKALQMAPDRVIEEMKKSKILGRGGAAFPTGRKWEGCRAAQGYPKYIICNSDEGVPGAWVDRTLLEGDPHAVLEGMLIAAHAIGSDQGYFYIRSEYPLAEHRFALAVRQAEERGLLGENILGSGLTFRVQVRRGAGSYLAGESSALMSSLEGGKAMPRLKRPRSVEKGLFAKPTTMNNVETFANVPHIIQNGGDWYAGIGYRESTGTRLFSCSGHVRHTGAIEVKFGTTMAQIVDALGGALPGHRIKMVQLDGPAGGILPANLFDMPLDWTSYANVTAAVGSGGIVVMDERTCVVDLLAYCFDFNEDESCDRCTTCRLGTQKMKAMLAQAARGEASPGEPEMMARLADAMKRNSHCGLGQAAPNPLFSVFRFFRDEVDAHVFERRCPAHVCEPLLEYHVDPARAALPAEKLSQYTAGPAGADHELVVDVERALADPDGVALLESPAVHAVDRPQPAGLVQSRTLAEHWLVTNKA